jgi:hypothetical protein
MEKIVGASRIDERQAQPQYLQKLVERRRCHPTPLTPYYCLSMEVQPRIGQLARTLIRNFAAVAILGP